MTWCNTVNCSRGRAAGRGGFTLAELLVALAVFSVLMATVTWSLALSARLVDSLELPFAPEAHAFGRLRRALGSTLHFVAEEKQPFKPTPRYRDAFWSDGTEVRFVSTAPPGGAGVRLCRLFREGNAVYLGVRPLFDAAVDYKDPLSAFSDTAAEARWLLWDEVSALSIECLHAGRLETRLADEVPQAIRLVVSGPERRWEVWVAVRSNYGHRKREMALHGRVVPPTGALP